VRSIEHGVFLDEEAIAMMLERGTFLVPTLIAPMGVCAGEVHVIHLTDRGAAGR
jgi:imidazolonepropionase-like amidohydrolase